LKEGKKIEIINKSTNKKLIAEAMGINRKNIYHKQLMDIKDQKVKSNIEDTFITHPSYGHRRLGLELDANHKRILRVMHKYNLKPPRLLVPEKVYNKIRSNISGKLCQFVKENRFDGP